MANLVELSVMHYENNFSKSLWNLLILPVKCVVILYYVIAHVAQVAAASVLY